MPYYCRDTQETAYSYAQYLKTTHWHNLRESLISATGGICQDCKQQDRILTLHHKNYDHVGSETRQDLEVLCTDCHQRRHSEKTFVPSNSLLHASFGDHFKGSIYPLCCWEIYERPEVYKDCQYSAYSSGVTCTHCKQRINMHNEKALKDGKQPLFLRTTPFISEKHDQATRDQFKRKYQAEQLKKAKQIERKRLSARQAQKKA